MKEFRHRLMLLGLVIILSRIPFLFDGFGSEEDAWALPMVAERIAETGIYEVSRLPGHPVQEIIYSTMYDAGPVLYNLVTMLISTAGLLAFAVTLRNFGHSQPLLTTFAVAVTPVIWINSTNDLDYTWALAFILMSGYFISKRFPILAGCMTGLATGCRITSGAMVLPFLLLIWFTIPKQERFKAGLLYATFTLGSAALCFLPVYLQYGTEFFTYYEHFPIPGFAKNFYKGVLGVWGLPGTIALIIAGIHSLKNRRSAPTHDLKPEYYNGLLYCALTAVLLYSISFIRLPLKSAFMIPVIPFLLLLLSMHLTKTQIRNTGIALLFSGLFFGINLAEARRGSAMSPLAITTSISGQPVAFDVLNGLVISDQSKRRQRTAFATSALKKISSIKEKTFIIAGWWQADLLYLSKDLQMPNILIRYYTDEAELKWYQSQGYRIVYLEDQDQINDLRFQKTFTRRYASQLVIE